MIIQTFKRSLLTWLGIAGGALTLLSNLQGVLDLAKWANWLVTKWRESLLPVVSGMIDLIGVKVSTTVVPMIAMAFFVSFIAIGARLENEFMGRKKELWPVQCSNVFNLHVLAGIGLYAINASMVAFVIRSPAIAQMALNHPYAFIAVGWSLYCGSIIVGLRGWPLHTSVVVAICMLTFSHVFAYSAQAAHPFSPLDSASLVIATIAATLCGLLITLLAPPLAFSKRMIFMIIGVGAVSVLSFLSQLGISATPPS